MASNYQITVTLEGRDNLSDELRQVNQQLGQIVTNTANTSQGVTRMENSVSGLRSGLTSANNLLGQFGVAISAMGIVRAVDDLNDLGREAGAVNTTFEQLSGGPDAAARSLENMRNITGHVVDDMALMKGANSLLLTGLASTNDQAAELVNLGYRLSAAMGVDATEGIQNLNAALLNNSFARLDTLGISAGQVRARVQELKDEGLDMSAAFSQAVLEQGREKLETLGEAATTGETAFNRLNTRLENTKQALGGIVANGVEAGAQLLEIFSLMNQYGAENVMRAGMGETIDIAAQERAARMSEMALAERDTLMGDTGSTFRDQIDTAGLAEMAQSDPDLFRRISEGGAFTNLVYGGPNQSGIAPEGLKAIFEQYTGGMSLDRMEGSYAGGFAQEMDVQLAAILAAERELTTQEAALAEQHDRLADASALAAEREAEYAEIEQRRLANVEESRRASSEEQRTLGEMEDMYGRLAQSATQFQEIGGVQIMDPDAAAEIINRADAMEQRFESLQQLAEDTEFQYISEEELGWAEEMSTQASALADQAERASAAFEKMSLAQMMGVSGGGRLGELTDMVTEAIGDETIQAQVQLELDLRSGRTTELEQAFEDEFSNTIAQIAEQVGPEAAADAAQRALAALEQGQLMGLSDEQIAESVRGAIGPVDFGRSEDAGLRHLGQDMGQDISGPGAAQAFSQPDLGMTLSGPLVAVTGDTAMGPEGATTTPQEQMEALIEQTAVLQEDAQMLGESFTNLSQTDLTGVMEPMENSLETVNTYANTLVSKLDTVAGKTYRTTIAIDVLMNDPTGIGAAIMTQQMAQATQQNGGVAPGTASGGTGPS